MHTVQVSLVAADNVALVLHAVITGVLELA